MGICQFSNSGQVIDFDKNDAHYFVWLKVRIFHLSCEMAKLLWGYIPTHLEQVLDFFVLKLRQYGYQS